MKKQIAVFSFLFFVAVFVQAKEPIFVSNAFYGGDMDKINYSDAKTVMRLWLQKTSKRLNVNSDLIFYTDFKTLQRDKKQHHKVDVLILSPYSYLQYLSFCKKNFTQGWLKAEADGKPFYSYVILKSSKDKAEKKDVVIEYYQYEKVAKLVAQKYAWKYNLQVSWKKAPKESKPVLDLFFKKCDIAIVNKNTWQLAKELNPQLGKNLKVVYETKRVFTDMVSLFANSMTTKQKNMYFLAMKDLTSTKSGKQLMRLFKFNALVRINWNQLSGLEEFYKAYLKEKALHEK